MDYSKKKDLEGIGEDTRDVTRFPLWQHLFFM